MKRRNFFTMLLAFAAMVLMFGIPNSASAQVGPGRGPCPTYWVNYNYVYGPAPSNEFTVTVTCADGRVMTSTNEGADGHYTYPADPTCIARSVTITDTQGNSWTFPIPAAQVTVITAWGGLNVESKFDSNGCLEIKLSY